MLLNHWLGVFYTEKSISLNFSTELKSELSEVQIKRSYYYLQLLPAKFMEYLF